MKLKQFIYAAIVISFCTTAGYIIAPIEVRFINSLTQNTFLIGLTYSIGSLVFGLLSVYLGRLSDLHGRSKYIKLGLGLGIFYPILYASTINVLQYMGVRFVWAFSTVACGPIFWAYMQDLLKGFKKKGMYMGYVYSVHSILGALAQFVGGYLAEHMGLTTPYYIMAALFLIGFILSLFLPKDKIKKSKEKRDLFFGIKYIFKKPALIFYFIQNTSYSMNWGIKPILWPLIIFAMTGSDTATGTVFASMGVIAFILLPFAGKIVDRINPFRALIMAMTFIAISGLVLSFTKSYIIFLIAAGVYTIGEVFSMAQIVLLTDNIESKYRGEIMGLDSVFDNFFATLSPFFAGLLLMFFSPQNVLLFYIIAIWISLGMMINKKKTIRLS